MRIRGRDSGPGGPDPCAERFATGGRGLGLAGETGLFALLHVAPGAAAPPGAFTDPNLHAVSYVDQAGNIPETHHLRLSPRASRSMHGAPRAAYVVRLDGQRSGCLDRSLPEAHDERAVLDALVASGHDPQVVHRMVLHRHDPIRAIVPAPVVSYGPDHPVNGLQAYQPAMTAAIREALGRNGHRVSTVHRHAGTCLQVTFPPEATDADLDRLAEVVLRRPDSDPRAGPETVFRASDRVRALPFRPRRKHDPAPVHATAFRRYALHREQGYLQDVLDAGQAELEHLEEQSTTCEEKLRILQRVDPDEDWTIDRVVAMHAHDSRAGLVLIVGPRLHLVDAPRLLAPLVGETRFAHALPDGMERGTGTPILLASTRFERMILLDTPPALMERAADYSIGGYGPSAHLASLHIAPQCMKRVLRRQFGDRVVSMPHPAYM